MKLIDFINNEMGIQDSDKLNSSNFLFLFKKIKQNNDFHIVLNNENKGEGYPNCLSTYKLNTIFNNIIQSKTMDHLKTNIFIHNADVCIPPVTDEYMLTYSNKENNEYFPNGTYIQYTETLQNEVMKIDFKNKLDLSIYKNIPKNVSIFSNQVYIKHPNVHFIPLGTQLYGDSTVGQNFYDLAISMNDIKKLHFMSDKSILCYLNCSTCDDYHVNFMMGNIRELCYKVLKMENGHLYTVNKI